MQRGHLNDQYQMRRADSGSMPLGTNSTWETVTGAYISNLVYSWHLCNHSPTTNGSLQPIMLIQTSLFAPLSGFHSGLPVQSAFRLFAKSDIKSIREMTVWV